MRVLVLLCLIFAITSCGTMLDPSAKGVDIRGDCNYAEAPCDASEGDETATNPEHSE